MVERLKHEIVVLKQYLLPLGFNWYLKGLLANGLYDWPSLEEENTRALVFYFQNLQNTNDVWRCKDILVKLSQYGIISMVGGLIMYTGNEIFLIYINSYSYNKKRPRWFMKRLIFCAKNELEISNTTVKNLAWVIENEVECCPGQFSISLFFLLISFSVFLYLFYTPMWMYYHFSIPIVISWTPNYNTYSSDVTSNSASELKIALLK